MLPRAGSGRRAASRTLIATGAMATTDRMAADAPYHQNPLSRAAKVILGAVCWGWLEARDAACRLAGRTAPGRATVIYYHQVTGDEGRRFTRQMQHLTRSAIPIRADRIDPPPPFSRCVAVTADDAWLSFTVNALPAMLERRIPVTLFALTGDLKRTDASEKHGDRLLGGAELQALPGDLVTIGSHGHSHTPMPQLSEREAVDELQNSRAALRALLGREVSLFSFPYGQYNDGLTELCRQAGYQRVFTGLPYPALREKREFVTGRVR